MHRTNRVPRAPLGGFLLLGLLFGAGAPRVWAQADAPPPGPRTATVAVAVGGTQRLQMTAGRDGVHPRIKTVVNDKDAVVNVAPLEGDPTSVLLTGRQPGTAHIALTSVAEVNPPTPETTETVEILVELDVELLRRLIRQAVPTAMVSVLPGAGNSIILAGTVAHAEDVPVIMNIARTITAAGTGEANVINAMRVGGVMQVQLDVVVALVSRDEIRRMSVDLFDAGQHHDFTTVPGGSINLPSPGSGITGQLPPVTQPFQIQNLVGTPNNAPFNSFLSIFSSRQAVFFFLQALRTNDLAKVLAEPHLVTMSGKVANFVSGGEQAVPNVTGFGGVAGVTFIPFGTTLQFLPIVLGNGKIYLEVLDEFSQLDNANGTQIGAGFVPGRDVQRVRTAVTMEDGQTFAVGGLIQHTVTAGSTKVPMIGDLPFIGPFFSAKNYREVETELVILVTPHLVDPMDCQQVPHYLPGQETRKPDDFELFLENILEAPRGSREVNHDRHYVPAWKNGPTAKVYPCISAGSGPPIGCPGCSCGGGNGDTGVPIPHERLLQPGPVPPHPDANVTVQQAPVTLGEVQPTSGTVEPAPSAASRSTTDRPASLPPVQSVPLPGSR